jgi:hypothetical protein
MIRLASPLGLALLLVACGDEPQRAPEAPRDPAVARALDDPLMTDPDLSSGNEGAAAITVVTDSGLPVVPVTPEAIAAARAEAAALVGGQDKLAPVPAATGRVPSLEPAHTPADHLATLADKSACRAKLANSTIWAARLPAALPVYPRGATLAATGGEGKDCRVVAVVFATPVPVSEVLAFYWRRAKAAGLAPQHRTAGAWSVLQGQGEGAAFDLRASRAGGQTTVELATVTG